MTDAVSDPRSGPVFTDDYFRDPYPVLAGLREHAPVREVELPEGGSTWLISRYADVRAAFADPRLAKDPRATMPLAQRPAEPLIPPPGGHMLLLNDPPVHTRLRKLVVQAFTVRRIAALRPITLSCLGDLPVLAQAKKTVPHLEEQFRRTGRAFGATSAGMGSRVAEDTTQAAMTRETPTASTS